MKSADTAHRPDIDGLRSLAILPVVAYHAGVQVIRGGFVGVDIFFVISGYLITQVLLRDIEGGRFSLLGFYERRIRRIFPALLVMLLITFAASLVYGFPVELIEFSKSLMAAALSVSNIFFWRTSGYFDDVALEKPLLHTWSLGVEEQFYIVWPVLLFLAYKSPGRRVLPLTLLGCAASFAVSAVGAFTNSSATFYLVHTRAWELLLGGVLALGALPRLPTPAVRTAVGLTGMLLIGVSVVAIKPYMPFPGLLALPPCLGAALIILAGRDGDSLAKRLMSWRPMVFIGLISYSLYLWHWPVIVFQRNDGVFVHGLSERGEKAVIIVLSVLIATVSWRLVEQPFRFGPLRPTRKRLFQLAAAVTCLVLAAGLAGVLSRGFPARYTEAELSVASFTDDGHEWRTDRCFLVPGSATRDDFSSECLSVDPHRKNYLLIGDSHAAQLWQGLTKAYPEINFLQATATGCFPTLKHGITESPFCSRLSNQVLTTLAVSGRVDRVVLAARWKADLADNLYETLDYLRQHGVAATVIGPSIVFDGSFPRLLVRGERARDPGYLDRRWNHSLVTFDSDIRLGTVAHGAEYISLIGLTTDHGTIQSKDQDGMPLIFDQEHFSTAGSLLIAQRMRSLGIWAGGTDANAL